MVAIEKLLKITQIQDKFKKKEGSVQHKRWVEITDEDRTFKIIVNDDIHELDSIFRKLDENVDLETEVELHMNIQLVDRQTRVDSFDDEVKELIDKNQKGV